MFFYSFQLVKVTGEAKGLGEELEQADAGMSDDKIYTGDDGDGDDSDGDGDDNDAIRNTPYFTLLLTTCLILVKYL